MYSTLQVVSHNAQSPDAMEAAARETVTGYRASIREALDEASRPESPTWHRVGALKKALAKCNSALRDNAANVTLCYHGDWLRMEADLQREARA